MTTAVHESLARCASVLVKILQESGKEDRFTACAAVANLGPHAVAAVPTLTRVVGEDWWAARALGEIGPGAREAVPALIEQLLAERTAPGPEGFWDHAAATALILIGAEEAVPVLVEAARGACEHGLNEWAQIDLRNRGPEAGAAVPMLARLWAEPEFPDCKYWFISWLGRMSPASGVGMEAIRTALRSARDVYARENIAIAMYRTLGQEGPIDPALGDEFRGLLDEAETARRWGILGLASLGEEQLLQPLGDLLEADELWGVGRAGIILRLGRPGASPAVVGLLRRLLFHAEGEVRCLAALALGRVGRDAGAALPGIQSQHRAGALDAPWFDVPSVVACIGGADPKGRLRHPSEGAPIGRVPHLDRPAYMREQPSGGFTGAVPHLISALADADESVQYRAARALGTLGPDAVAAVPELVHALTEARAAVLSDALVEALGRMGPEGEMAVDVLGAILLGRHPGADEDTAEHAVWALAGTRSPAAIPFLNEIIRRRGPQLVAPYAIRALGTFGPLAATAVPVLREWLAEEKRHNFHSKMLRRALQETLSKIDPSEGRAAEVADDPTGQEG